MQQTCFLVCVLISASSNLFGLELCDVIAHPEKFENRRVTLVGIARVPGYFYICPDEKAAADRHPENALLVRRKSTSLEYREMDRQWVEVTGIMSDKERRGYEFGPMFWEGHAILLEHVRELRDRPSPRIKDATVWGVFKNSTSKPLAIDLLPRTHPNVEQIFFLGPNETQTVQITEGRADALKLEGPANLRLDERKRGERVATGQIKFRSLRHGYEYSRELSQERTLYFRIIDHRIEEAAASEERRWKIR